MPRGGYRPGAGRKADPEKKKAREAAKASREPHGYTTPTGEKAEDAPKDWPFGKTSGTPEVPAEPKLSFSTPLEFWEHVLADPGASPSAKQTAAYSMAPYVHAKIAPAQKKEEAKGKSKKASAGKYAAARAPVLAAANGKRV